MRNHAKIWAALSMAFCIGSSASLASKKDAAYRTRECAFRYPAEYKLSVAHHGTVIRLALPSRSQYWQDAVAIRKHNKKTEECDLPQSTTPEAGPKRKIAGRVAYGYSGEDAAMNRFVKTKGYVFETTTSCWRFELIRKGRPWQKFGFSNEEQKRLDKQSEQDTKAAEAAFKMILDSFVLPAR